MLQSFAYALHLYSLKLPPLQEHENVKNSKKRRLSAATCGDISKKPCRNCGNNESAVSSTGSCSTSGKPYQDQAFCYADDDAVSSFVPMKKTSFPKRGKRDQEMEKEAHKLEVDAYHSTMAALHAKGSISWEQEALLSNLRLLLNISIDEQQHVLRSLGSSR
jgi:ENT domain